MGICGSVKNTVLNPDEILANINKFFGGMAIKKLGIDELTTKVKNRIFSDKVTDIEGWKNFLKEDVVNSEFGQTSKEFVGIAMDDAQQNYGDQTLPFLSLFFMADGDKDKFVNAFKAINLAKNASESGEEIKNVIETGKNGGILAGIKQGVKAIKNVSNVAKQATNPNFIKKEDLKNLSSYYVNFVTLLPVNILSKYNEGGRVQSWITNVLNDSFNKESQDNYVEQTLFANYKDPNIESIDINEFFEENYLSLKNDNALRKGLVKSYIESLTPKDMAQIVKGTFINLTKKRNNDEK